MPDDNMQESTVTRGLFIQTRTKKPPRGRFHLTVMVIGNHLNENLSSFHKPRMIKQFSLSVQSKTKRDSALFAYGAESGSHSRSMPDRRVTLHTFWKFQE